MATHKIVEVFCCASRESPHPPYDDPLRVFDNAILKFA